ncbi:MAG TPA: Flp family type IVb pilin [Geminicoccaceae bacterium]|nr:Flp family type IVb pilin [Geminicoccaceae bacterium]
MKRQDILLRAHSLGRNAALLWPETSGAVAVEYGLIAALIAVALIGAIVQLGESLFGLPLQTLINALIGADS